MKQKRLMLLGGLSYLLPVIREAHNMGIYVITADYLPNNIAHKYSDEYCNVSIIDKEEVLKKAQSLQIDGIMSFAVDPGVVSAAYVAEKMQLPFQCSYKAATILQNKHLFRQFLAENGFNSPKAKGYNNVNEALEDVDFFSWPVIVKPVDSAGSKGVSKVERKEDLSEAISYALSEAHNGYFIIEEFLEKEGNSSGIEAYIQGEQVLCNDLYDQLFDDNAVNPFTPSAEIWPSSMPLNYQCEIKEELKRLFILLNVRTGIFNVECRVSTNGKAYLMEVSPRGGGNRIAELQDMATGQSLISAEICKAVSLPLPKIESPSYKGAWCNYVLHSSKPGILGSIDFDKDFLHKYVKDVSLTVKQGDAISTFTGANTSLGTVFLYAESRPELDEVLRRINDYIHINIL
ncbi:putative phosphoribosylamine--glycine ligase [Prevotella amnii CRIS 21A-A]|uniref:Putative phosphoribosylamine--glycine ligase n=1 Tax=Prevotella amnii CRIS 21A-A TaxID=679191 RepID=E1GX51_9BACT|nr:ATP-grasp domain-containing protein [Prevotella amnii]EFN90766.1 putative phosphoribosylamine--glycine ligase [Prevotella amnii CRIS 21A-A]